MRIRNLVSYYLSKDFVTLNWDSQALKNIPLRVKQLIYDVNMIDSDAMMICSTAITSAENTLKNIYLSGTVLNEFMSAYYDDNNDSFEMLFQQYTASAVKKLYHPDIVEEWKDNMEKEDYGDDLHKIVVRTHENR